MGTMGTTPTHCPRWAEMDQTERTRIARKAGFCHRCFHPNFTSKAGPDLRKHNQTECYISKSNKHKYSCLNKECLKHSWICKDHVEENKPLFNTHCKELADKKQNITLSFVTLSSPLNPLSKGPEAHPRPRAPGWPTLTPSLGTGYPTKLSCPDSGPPGRPTPCPAKTMTSRLEAT